MRYYCGVCDWAESKLSDFTIRDHMLKKAADGCEAHAQAASRWGYLPPAIKSVEDIRRYHRGEFFSPGNMRFFGTRICASGRVFGGRYFVTSEQPPRGPRIYVIRRYDAADDSFESVNGDGAPGLILDVAFQSRKAAISAAKRLGAEPWAGPALD